MRDNRYLAGPFDAVVNFILLKDGDIAANRKYADGLIQFCKKTRVRHLIHISSPSSIKSSESLITETSPFEANPETKGSYGSIKAAADVQILSSVPPALKLSMLMPGFILGSGVVNPIVGSAVRLPSNHLLCIGDGYAVMPMTTRALLHQAVLRVLVAPPSHSPEVLLIVDPHSPTRRAYLDACCTVLGCGRSVVTMPSLVWWAAGVLGEVVAPLVGMWKLRPLKKISGKLLRLHYEPRTTARRLGMSLAVDWRAELRRSLDGQQADIELPPVGERPGHVPSGPVTIIGAGGIVQKRYLPALSRLGHRGRVEAFDVFRGRLSGGVEVSDFRSRRIRKSRLYVVASPGPVHVQAINRLRGLPGVVLIEKPAAQNPREFAAWLAFAKARRDPVLVCHNYRFKRNVLRMCEFLAIHSPGLLHHVSLQFQSPSVATDSAEWRRDERRARTLLMDYGLHFLDLACMFGRGDWDLKTVRHEVDAWNRTSVIQGGAKRGSTTVDFLLRQGFAPRSTRIRFNFQNYSVTLGFFPDLFAVHMNDLAIWPAGAEIAAALRGLADKVAERVFHSEPDRSHDEVISRALAAPEHLETTLGVKALKDFYGLAFQIGERVYGGSRG